MKKYLILMIVSIMILTSCTTFQIQIPEDAGNSYEENNEDLINNGDVSKENQGGENEIDKAKDNLNTEKVAINEDLMEMENAMVELVNKERENNGLNTLKLDEKLRDVARIKSRDIADNDYFDHTSPTYGSPFEMMESFGIDFVMAAENLAGHQSVKEAHEGLMKSEGHRENILRPGLSHIGIGIIEDDKYEYIFTQMFIKKN